MTARDVVVESFWAVMRDNNWDAAAAHFADGEPAARAIVIAEVEGDRIVRQVEYWPTPYEPEGWRAELVERIEPIPEIAAAAALAWRA